MICWVCNLPILKVYPLLLFQLSDGFPKPYPNEQAARAANVGKKCDMEMNTLCYITYISCLSI